MKIGIKILNERAIPVGTESGILILIASMLVNNPKNFTATIDIIIETNSPCAPITPAPNPLTTTGSFKPSTTGNYLNVWIYNIIQLPLQALANTTGGILVLALVNQLFWFLGIHGGMVIEGVRGPLSAAGLAENISAVQAGGVATNILTRG